MQPFLRRILCADDDKSTLEMMEFWLGRQGYEEETVETISEILRLAEQGPSICIYSMIGSGMGAAKILSYSYAPWTRAHR